MDLLIAKKRKNSKITGEVKISGAKNSAVAIIPAALLTDEEVCIHNVPNITDVHALVEIMKEQGHYAEFNDNTLKIKRGKKGKWVFGSKVNKLRGSYYFIGTYLAYFGKIAIKSSGGCDLGARPTNYHHTGFLALGAKYRQKKDYDIYKCKRSKGANISLPYPSVGATINLILASVLSSGITKITNFAREIEVGDVCNFLNSMGAKISGFENDTLIIKGVEKLHSTNYTIIPDRIEAGTYLAFGCLKEESPVTVTGISPDYLESFLSALKEMGHQIVTTDNSITATKGNTLKPIHIHTNPYPEFPTDLGPIITVLMTQIPGTSTLTETIFSNRFSQVDELNQMGANITCDHNTLIIVGPTNFTGGCVDSHDLRCAAALVIAGSIATKDVLIKNIDPLARGYENYLNKLIKIRINAINKTGD